MFYLLLVLFAGGIVALDQWTKALAIAADAAGKLPSKSILGIFHIALLPEGNTGGMWGLFKGQMWLFILVMVLFLVLIAIMIWKKWVTKKFEWLCLAAIAGGGIGNIIDRLAKGAVTDMIKFDFIEFPTFNVADCFITCGCIALMIYVIFFDREKKPKTDKPAEAE
ncbi:MAG: signal peptidase II [Faecousia sp.]